jgi:hypothetical protein
MEAMVGGKRRDLQGRVAGGEIRADLFSDLVTSRGQNDYLADGRW